MIDRGTSWSEASSLTNITAKEVINAFNKDWISRLGVPSVVITDQVSQFESKTFTELYHYFGIDKRRTTAWQLQANGKIEGWHRTLKNSSRAHSENASSSWLNDLLQILLSLRNYLISNSDCSLSQLVFGQSARMPGDFIFDAKIPIDLPDNIQDIRSAIKKLKTVHVIPSCYNRPSCVEIIKDFKEN